MPYPNEHSARIVNPGEFQKDSFRRKVIKSGISIIFGKLKGENNMIAQAYRFKKDKFTATEAKKWLKDHKIKYIKFEKAIKTNENMKGKLSRYINTNTVYNIRTEKLLGKDNIVVPVVMMVEGVHCGSAGPTLHTAEELGKVPESWNGIPIVINHPELNGQNVSANNPKIIDKEIVGRVYNTKIDDLKLKAEAWIDIERINKISPETLAMIRNNKPIDVSVGVFSEDEDKVGIYNNEEYQHIAHNHRPDHLALLPEGVGACSWEDGCGIRLNKKGEKNEMTKLNLNDFPYKEGKISFITNKEEYLELLEKLRTKLRSLDNDNFYYFLKQVYSDYIIYGFDDEKNGIRKYFKQKYKIVNGQIELDDNDKQEVEEEIKYVKIKNFKKEEKMTKKKTECTPCVQKKAEELINNKFTTFTKEDKEWLEAQTEERLDSLVPKIPVQDNKKQKEKEEPKKETRTEEKTPIEVFKESLKNPEDYFNLMPAEMQESMREGLKLHQANKKRMITSIMDNSKDVWKEEELKNMSSEVLTKIYKSTVKDEGDYSVQAIETNMKTNSEEVLLPPGIVKKEKN